MTFILPAEQQTLQRDRRKIWFNNTISLHDVGVFD